MSSTGATLSGSYSDATATPTAAGFKYGTTSGELNQTASSSASGTSGDLSATLTGLASGTTYYYKAYVTVNGTGDYASTPGTFYGEEESFTTTAVATASVSASTSLLSATGVTLNGSYSGETGAISERGFYYGTASGNLNNKVTTTSTSGKSFSKDLTGLSPNGTYYFKAYIKEFDQNAGAAVERLSEEQSFHTLAIATATVSNSAATSVTATGATLNGSYSGATGTVSATGFYYGTSSSNLQTTGTRVVNTGSSATPFSKALTGLTANTTYYYKAFVVEYNENTDATEERLASGYQSFTTSAATQPSVLPGYLGCYEVPGVSNILNGSETSGTNSNRGDKWFRYYTNNNKRQIATHTFAQASSVNSNQPQTRNYTLLFDQDKYAPLWVAYAMHSNNWKKILSGRSGSWGTDPAISLTQQTGLDNASTVGYSRGHMVSSQERQTTSDQNDQTFYYTNQAPQWQNSFNSGVWSTMETAIVNNAPSGRDTLYIVTGVLYEESWYTANPSKPRTLTSGDYTVPIPSHFYKCLMKCSFNTSGTMTAAQGIAYIFTNEAHSGNYYDSEYVTTIDAVETRAGFDFFANVPSSLQNEAENTATALWSYSN